MEDRLKTILKQMNEEHSRKIDSKIMNVFYLGFVMGTVFAYAGFTGFFTGIITGVIICRKFPEETEKKEERFIDRVTGSLIMLKKSVWN